MKTNRKIGNSGEITACNWLVNKGYAIVERNYHSRYGEIDIIACNDRIIAFVEVKTLKEKSLVNPVYSVGRAKQQKIIKTAMLFLQNFQTDLQPRFDVCIITNKTNATIDYYENAFF